MPISVALETAYASNSETPLSTIQFQHSSLPDGKLSFVNAKYDLEATTEEPLLTVFAKSSIDATLPEISTDGRQELQIAIDNTDGLVYQSLKVVVNANRLSEEKVLCVQRMFLPSDLTQPSGEVLRLTITTSSVNRSGAVLRATYAKLPETRFPSRRYDLDKYPGLAYAG